ncbi:helix-turn-helix transcriptional regulator [Sporosarcina sp. OR05]|uniref:helix-turn-helix transcriptional regulator n=1 Tax=Sporosarcina sp. OR05 TaxID=2969819 RepID=UPI00352BC23C
MKQINLNRVKRLRNQHRLSQGDMAEIIGLSSLYPYHRKESGAQSFTAEEIHAIATHFGKNVEYFFEEDVAENAI